MRFQLPSPGAASPITFPPIARTALANGLRVWTVRHASVPVATILLVVPFGTANDPVELPGLASLTGDMLDEGAGARDAIALADALARLGATLDLDVGADATTIAISGLSRHVGAALELLADVVMRPRLELADLERVRELRFSRLRQMSRSAGAMADRAFVTAVFASHPYGHGSLGTTAALERIDLERVRMFWRNHLQPTGATLIACGDVDATLFAAEASRAFGGWPAAPLLDRPEVQETTPDPRALLVHRPGAAQAELRVGHVGPPRVTSRYHALVAVNAMLGGQFVSRINRVLREEKGITYGARTSFDFRRIGGTFSCDTSVQADATIGAVADVLREFAHIGDVDSVEAAELGRAQASLTRGYVRGFETSTHLVRAAAQLATYDLPDDTFDRFVPAVEAVTIDDATAVARSFVRPADATIVIVGDLDVCAAEVDALDRVSTVVTPEF